MAKRSINTTKLKILLKSMKNKPISTLRKLCQTLRIQYSVAKTIYQSKYQDKIKSKGINDFKRADRPHKIVLRKRNKKYIIKDQGKKNNLDDHLLLPSQSTSNSEKDEFKQQPLGNNFHCNLNGLFHNTVNSDDISYGITAKICWNIKKFDNALKLVKMQRQYVQQLKRNLELDLATLNAKIQEEQFLSRSGEDASHFCIFESESSPSSEPK